MAMPSRGGSSIRSRSRAATDAVKIPNARIEARCSVRLKICALVGEGHESVRRHVPAASFVPSLEEGPRNRWIFESSER